MTDEMPESASAEPPVQPAEPPPEAPTATWTPPAPAGPSTVAPKLPGTVQAAAVILLVFGTLAGIGTALMVLALFALAALPVDWYGPMMRDGSWMGGGWGGGFGGFWWMGMASVGVMAVLGAAVTGGHIAAGVAIFQRRAWGRVLGMVVSGVALVLIVLGIGSLLTSVAVPMPMMEDLPGFPSDYYKSVMTATLGFSTVVALLVGAAYAFVLWVLARRGDAFE